LFVDFFEFFENVAGEGRLAGIDVSDEDDVRVLFCQEGGAEVSGGVSLFFHEGFQVDLWVALPDDYLFLFLDDFSLDWLFLFGFGGVFFLLVVVEVVTFALFLYVLELFLVEIKSNGIEICPDFLQPGIVLLVIAGLSCEDVVDDKCVEISEEFMIGGQLCCSPFLVHRFVQDPNNV
jgi:hypothetical protein